MGGGRSAKAVSRALGLTRERRARVWPRPVRCPCPRPRQTGAWLAGGIWGVVSSRPPLGRGGWWCPRWKESPGNPGECPTAQVRAAHAGLPAPALACGPRVALCDGRGPPSVAESCSMCFGSESLPGRGAQTGCLTPSVAPAQAILFTKPRSLPPWSPRMPRGPGSGSRAASRSHGRGEAGGLAGSESETGVSILGLCRAR